MTTATIPINSASVEMEESILGSILFDPDRVQDVQELPAAAFSISNHRTIYNAIWDVHRAGYKPDLPTVARSLRESSKLDSVGGKAKLAALMDRIVHSGNTKQYAQLLLESYVKVDAIKSLKEISEIAETEDDVDTAIALAKEKIANLERSRGSVAKVARVTSRKSSFDQVMMVVEAMFEEFEDDPARMEWEFIQLAQQTGIPKAELKMMWRRSKEGAKKPRSRSVKEFLAEGSDEREWIIGGYIPKGTTICLFADGGVGKTLLAYDLAKAIASGTYWNGFPTKQGKVLIVQTDEPEIDTRERLNTAKFADLPEDSAHIISDWQFNQMRQLKKIIEQQQPSFVIIDSLTSANRADSENEKDASYAAPLYDLRDIANEYGCTFMVLHHENKAGGARGTTGIKNNVSEVWRLRKGDKVEALLPTQRIIESEKTRCGFYTPVKIELNLDDYSWSHLGEAGTEDIGGKLPLSARLLSYLEANRGVRFEPEELVHEFAGSSKDAIRKSLERHRKQGLLFSEERVKQRETGMVRYKVYYSPPLPQNECPGYECPGYPEQGSSASNIPNSTTVSNTAEKPNQDKPKANLDKPNLDTVIPGGEGVVKTDLPKIGQRVTINASGGNFDGREATVVGYSKDDHEFKVKLDTDGSSYSGYELDYKPEYLVW